MQIDWNYLATTPGYKSLKAAYVHDLKQNWRTKKELYAHFQWVISRAKHYAYTAGEPIENILNAWEEQRNYWWMNYYQNCRQPRKPSASLVSMGIAGKRMYYKNLDAFSSRSIAKQRINEEIKKAQMLRSKKVKKRWTTEKKKAVRRQKNL